MQIFSKFYELHIKWSYLSGFFSINSINDGIFYGSDFKEIVYIYILVLNYGTAISVGRPPYRINFIPIGFTKCGSVDLSPFYFNFFFQYENLRWKIFMLLIEKNIDSFLLKIFEFVIDLKWLKVRIKHVALKSLCIHSVKRTMFFSGIFQN